MKFNKLFKRSILGDYDRDGVMNAFDCQPKNKRKQDSKQDLNLAREDLAQAISEKQSKEVIDFHRKEVGEIESLMKIRGED